MAKRNIAVYSLIFMFLIALIFSCGNGSSAPDAENENNALNVSLAVSLNENIQRVLSVNDDWGIYVYKYTATPMWAEVGNAEIQGTVAELTEFSVGSPLPCKMSPGLWKFEVRVYDGEALIYIGSSDTTYISSGNTSVQVAVSGLNIGSTSGVDIEVKVPVARASVSDTLAVSWSGTEWGSTEIPSGTDDGEGYIVFRKTIEGLTPGGYTFFYSLMHLNGNYSILSGEASHLNISESAIASVSGILDGYSTLPRPSARVTFVDNRAHYAISGESWSNISLPVARNIYIGDAIEASNVPTATATYTLSGNSYSIQCANTQWYTDAACTKIWNMASAVTQDMTLYASWHCSGKTIEQTSTGKEFTFTVPKFITSISGYCIGGGGASQYMDASVDDNYCEVGICSEGGWGSASNGTYTSSPGGKTITLYTGAPATASYINVSGNRWLTGAAGSSGGAVKSRFNIYDADSSYEKKICSVSSIPCIIQQCAKNGSTNLVNGYSIRGNVRFQFYRSSGNSNAGTIKLRISTNGGSSWNAYDKQVCTYSYNDESGSVWNLLWGIRMSSNPVGATHAYTPSTYGQPGSGGYAVSFGKSYKVTQQAGYRGRSYVTLK